MSISSKINTIIKYRSLEIKYEVISKLNFSGQFRFFCSKASLVAFQTFVHKL